MMERLHIKARIPLFIFVVLVSLAAIMPSYLNGEFQKNNREFQKNLKSCLALEGGSWPLQPQGVADQDQLNCLLDYKKQIFNLYIFGVITIDELAIWVLGVDRRVIVIKAINGYGLIKASDIAEKSGRSLQNISHAIRELEEHGLIKCLTPEKHTWKRFILTEKGTEVFEKLRKNHLID